MKTQTYAIAFFVLCAFLLVSCDKEPENTSKSYIFDTFCSVAPDGWDCEIITDHFNSGDIPVQAGDPIAIVKYKNDNREFNTYDNTHVHPSLTLNIYPVEQKEQLIELIRSQQLLSWCVPVYYGETANYFVVTSPCFINGGAFTEEANASMEDLHTALGEFITFNDYGLIFSPKSLVN